MIFRRKDFFNIKFDKFLDLLFFCIQCKYFNNIAFGNIELLNIYRVEHFYLVTLIRKMKREHSNLKIFIFVLWRILFQTRYSSNKEERSKSLCCSMILGGRPRNLFRGYAEERRIIISHSVETSNISPLATRRRRRHQDRWWARSVRNRFPVERFREMIYCAMERDETAETSGAWPVTNAVLQTPVGWIVVISLRRGTFLRGHPQVE